MTPPITESYPGEQMEDGTIYAGISPDTGKAMYATPRDAPKAYNFDGAPQYAALINRQAAHNRNDWRVPTEDELNVLWENRDVIGGFDNTGARPAGWYWSCSHNSGGGSHARGQRFSDGHRSNNSKYLKSSVRCVRG